MTRNEAEEKRRRKKANEGTKVKNAWKESEEQHERNEMKNDKQMR